MKICGKIFVLLFLAMFAVEIGYAIGYPATIYSDSSYGVESQNLSGTQTIHLYGTGSRGWSGSYLCSNDYYYTVPDYEYGTHTVYVKPVAYVDDTATSSYSQSYGVGGGYGTVYYNPIGSTGYNDYFSNSYVYLNSFSATTNWLYAVSGSAGWSAPGGSGYTTGSYTSTHSSDGVRYGGVGETPVYWGGDYLYCDAWSNVIFMSSIRASDLSGYPDANGFTVTTTAEFLIQDTRCAFGSYIAAQIYTDAGWVSTDVTDYYGLATYSSGNWHTTNYDPTYNAAIVAYSRTVTGSSAYQQIKTGTTGFGLRVYGAEGFWGTQGLCAAMIDYAWMQVSYHGTHICSMYYDSAGYSSVLLVEGGYFVVNAPGSVSYAMPVGTFSTSGSGIGMYCYPNTWGLFNTVSWTLSGWSGTRQYEATADRFPLYGDLRLDNKENYMTKDNWNWRWSWTFPDLDAESSSIYNAGTIKLRCDWENNAGSGFERMYYATSLDWGQFYADLTNTYTSPDTTYSFTQPVQSNIAVTWDFLQFPRTSRLTLIDIDSPPAETPSYYERASPPYTGDSPKWNVIVPVPTGSRDFPIGVSNTMNIRYVFETDIPTLSDENFPATIYHSEYETVGFSVKAYDSISGVEKVFLCYKDDVNPPYVPNTAIEMAYAGSNTYVLSTSFHAGNYTMWFLVQDNAGNYRTSTPNHQNFAAVYPFVYCDNGTSANFEMGVGTNYLNFTVDGLGGTSWKIEVNGTEKASGTWSGYTEVHYNLDSMSVGSYEVSFNASNSEGHSAQYDCIVDVWSTHPVVTALNGTSCNIEYGSIGNTVAFRLEGHSPDYYNITRNLVPVVPPTSWSSPKVVTASMDGLAVGDYIVNCSANNTSGFSSNVTTIVHVGNFPPVIVPLNGTSVNSPYGTAANVAFQITSQIVGNYTLSIDDGVVASGDWFQGDIIQTDLSGLSAGSHNISLWANNSNDASGTHVDVLVNIYLPPSFVIAPSSATYNEDTGSHYSVFRLSGTNPDYYQFIVNGSVRVLSSWMADVDYTIMVNASDAIKWGPGLYVCSIFVRNVFGENVSSQFNITIVATFPKLTKHPSFQFYLSDIAPATVLSWSAEDESLCGYKLYFSNVSEFDEPIEVVLAEGRFNSTTGNVTFDFAGLFLVGEYDVVMMVNDTHGRTTKDAFKLTVMDNPPSIQLNLGGLFLWAVIIGLFAVFIWMLKQSGSRYWTNTGARNTIIITGVAGIAAGLTALSFAGYAPFYSYRFAELVAQWNESLGVYGSLILVGVVAAVFVAGYFVLRYFLKRRAL